MKCYEICLKYAAVIFNVLSIMIDDVLYIILRQRYVR